MKKLPIGIQTLSKIIENDYYYVDKTQFVKKLEYGGYYFLSRPRRFGKSLFLDTLKEAFSGNMELFKGLYLYDNWDWTKKYPIIRLDLSKASTDTEDNLIKSINSILNSIAKSYQIVLNEDLIQLKFEELIQKLYEKYNQKVVVLIDEYDKPILDVIEDTQKAKNNREILKKFFEILKPSDPYLHFVFITGVSRFSKVSIFSGLNQLMDITLVPDFATICGYTQKELETVFEDRIKDFDKEEVKRWYNGYNWLGDKVYNPFDILLFLTEKIFKPYWFETGTPTFLIKLFQKSQYYLPDLENLEVGEEIISNLDIDNIYPENLLFQAGYLTIKEQFRKGIKQKYILTYPNLEVRVSLNDAFLNYIIKNPVLKEKTESRIYDILQKDNIQELKETLYSLFASIPSDWYRKNNINEYEGFYASVVYALLNGSGLTTITEDATNKGKIDLTVIVENKVYIIEFKVVKETEKGEALQQIKEKRYYEKYTGKEIYLIGIEFSKERRNIVNFEVEKVG
ncbi:ATP-binding protein [Calditerrivibrio nitroreducens]|uniref:AAA-ATPase n=1 Tax=Calditerrivibrio nitroreducens (strain DSM 19672 / NBRC 101217 / Yu37-1) TaxID=768670 RepID=E4THC1_CALNY|nr:ATP-binding protein [Calditerrivibrio nitroreducens]ADR19856.1 AAA-ATPase [Calditerrivibrio nitroreducens DSM 19672]